MFLQPSRYSHYSLTECSPSYEKCMECFRYWCGSCGYGLGSMYSSCDNEDCAGVSSYYDYQREVYYPHLNNTYNDMIYFEMMDAKVHEEIMQREELHQKLMKELLEKTKTKY